MSLDTDGQNENEFQRFQAILSYKNRLKLCAFFICQNWPARPDWPFHGRNAKFKLRIALSSSISSKWLLCFSDIGNLVEVLEADLQNGVLHL